MLFKKTIQLFFFLLETLVWLVLRDWTGMDLGLWSLQYNVPDSSVKAAKFEQPKCAVHFFPFGLEAWGICWARLCVVEVLVNASFRVGVPDSLQDLRAAAGGVAP